MDIKTGVKELKKYGFYKVNNVLDKSAIVALSDELDGVYNMIETGDEYTLPTSVQKDSYGYGKILRIPKEAYGRFVELNKYINIDWFNAFVDEYYGFCYNKKLQTFCTHDYVLGEECNNPPRNSFLHVDPYQAIKFICYLTDTTEENGAFRCIPETTHIGEKTRNNYDLQELLTTSKYCFNESNKFYDESMLKDLVYLEGKAGDVLVVNTDIVHGGGTIKKSGAFRKTVNLHNRGF
jgi:hypothetical protein